MPNQFGQTDLKGRRFGKLTALESIPGRRYKKGRWTVVCDCGARTSVRTSHLLSGNVKSCGHDSGAPGRHRPYARVNLQGKTFGSLKILRPAPHIKTGVKDRPMGKTAWVAECLCGRVVIVATANITRGKRPLKSCGCDRLLPAAPPTPARVRPALEADGFLRPLAAENSRPEASRTPTGDGRRHGNGANGNGSTGAARRYVPDREVEFDVVWNGAVDRPGNGNGHHDSRPYVPDMPEHTTSAGEALRREHDLYSPLGRVRRVSWPAGTAPGEDDGVSRCEHDGDPMVMGDDPDDG